MKSTYRVVVIGGGVGGASTLYHLAKFGWKDVVLLERDDLTSGTTWHSAAQVTEFGTVQTMVGLKHYSTQLYTELNDDPDFPMGYHKGDGGIRLAHTQSDLDGYKHFIGMAKGMGVDYELLSPEECGRRHPLLNTAGLTGGLWDPVDGDIDPSNLTRGLCHAAKKLGAEVYINTPVTGLTQKDNHEWIVHTPKGDVQCEFIVNATGYRVNEVGKMYNFEHPVISMEHQYMITTEIPEIIEFGKRIPLIRDPGDDFYCRQEHNGLLLGIYEQGCKTWGMEGIPGDFTRALITEDMDRLLDNFDRVVERMPPLATVGITTMVNGPITYSPNGLPLIGKIPGVRNAYSCIGLRAGIGEGGGLGKILAEIMIYGESEWDSWILDPRQYTAYATTHYTAVKSIEEYQNEFVFHRPHEYRPAGRPAKTTPLYHQFLQKGGFFGPLSGWERVMYFNDPENPIEHVPSFRFSTWHDLVGEEVKGIRENAGLTEISGFSRFEVKGPGAADFLDYLSTNRLPKVGRIALAYFCRENGHFVTEATITRLAEDHLWLLCAAPAEFHDWQWFEEKLPSDGSVTMTNLTGSHTALHLAGPKSQEILQKVTLDKVDNENFPWLATRNITIGYARVQAIRVTFTGEMGYELHFPSEYSQGVYDLLCKAGADHNMIHFGHYAVESMRLEQGYLGWKTEIMSEVTPIEAGLGRFVKFKKGDFLGRDALLKQKEEGLPKTLVSMIVQNDIAPAHEGDPVYAGNEIVGVVTSGGYGYGVGANIAMAYLDTPHAAVGTKLEISIIGNRSPAEIVKVPLIST